jgi:hypothetical protein
MVLFGVSAMRPGKKTTGLFLPALTPRFPNSQSARLQFDYLQLPKFLGAISKNYRAVT